jgi:hypothetical protein
MKSSVWKIEESVEKVRERRAPRLMVPDFPVPFFGSGFAYFHFVFN